MRDVAEIMPRRPSAARRRERVVWLAVAEGRGHLVRAQLAAHLLAPAGIDVDIVTTSTAGAEFCAELGTRAEVVSNKYRLIYDHRQNVALTRTRAMALRYLASPRRCARDLAWLEGYCADAALVINDSFHPALLAASLVGAQLADRVVHVHGENTRRAVDDSAGAGPMRWMIRRALGRSRRIEITLGERSTPSVGCVQLPPLLPAPRDRATVRAELGVPAGRRLAVVYLNPYFHDPALADAIDAALSAAGCIVHAVGEGYADRPGWRARDRALPDAVGAADVFLSAPGAGAIALASAAGVPMIALASDQPEQRRNLGAPTRSWRAVVDLAGDVPAQLAAALARLPPPGALAGDADLAVRRARALWLGALQSLISRKDSP